MFARGCKSTIFKSSKKLRNNDNKTNKIKILLDTVINQYNLTCRLAALWELCNVMLNHFGYADCHEYILCMRLYCYIVLFKKLYS